MGLRTDYEWQYNTHDILWVSIGIKLLSLNNWGRMINCYGELFSRGNGFVRFTPRHTNTSPNFFKIAGGKNETN